MSGELEALLRLVSEGKLTAEEAAPIVAALAQKAPPAVQAPPGTLKKRPNHVAGNSSRKHSRGGDSGFSSPRMALRSSIFRSRWLPRVSPSIRCPVCLRTTDHE